MEDTKSGDKDDYFFDASDDFPFYDCPHSPLPLSPANTSSANLRRRRRPPLLEPDCQKEAPISEVSTSQDTIDSTLVNGETEPWNSEVTEEDSRPMFGDSKVSTSRNAVDSSGLMLGNSVASTSRNAVGPMLGNSEVSTSQNAVDSSGPMLRNSEVSTSWNAVDLSGPMLGNSELLTSGNAVDSSGPILGNSEVTEEHKSEELYEREINYGGQLNWMAELLVKAIEFQFRVLIGFLTFPFWVLYYGFMIFVNPFYIIEMGRSYLTGKLMRLWNFVCDSVSPLLFGWIGEQKPLLDFVLRCGWGVFWSVYVCSVLVALLVSAFVIGGLMTRYYVVEEPFQLKHGLNFDYTKSKPEAFVPIMSCNNAVNFGDEGGSAASRGRVLSPNHKLQATVTLILPESDYNRNLGIFQVRVDFLSEHGKSLASLSHPCMLKFRSGPLRLLLTLFKIAPLVTGYMSESQTLNLKFRGYRESLIPTACLKVTIEQRAEFQPAGGIPEIYDAFLHLESELPFLKKIKWYWRRTIFVWLSMTLFVVELVFALSCCRPLIIPRARTRTRTRGIAVRNATDTPQN